MRIPTLVTAPLLCIGCASQAPHVIESEHGRVHGRDRADVERVVRALEIGPAIRDVLQSPREDPPQVWLGEQARTDRGAFGTCTGTRIWLAHDAYTADDPAENTSFYVAHEVAHWYIETTPFVRLPLFLQEGLADYVTLEVLDWQYARRAENEYVGEVLLDPRDLWIREGERWVTLPLEYGGSLARVGYEVVSRLGLERLRELIASGTDPIGYLVAADMALRVPIRRGPASASTTSGSGQVPANPNGTPPASPAGEGDTVDIQPP